MHIDEYFDDLGVAYRAEIKELYDLGCRKCLLQLSNVTTTIDSALTLCYITGHIQFDDPTFCYFCNDGMIKGMEAAGVDHEALLDTYIRAINVCTQGRADDLTVGVHMCRGNFRVSTPGYSSHDQSQIDWVLTIQGQHFCEGGYARIAPKLFTTLDVDTFYVSGW